MEHQQSAGRAEMALTSRFRAEMVSAIHKTATFEVREPQP
jgi:hypothetical protein